MSKNNTLCVAEWQAFSASDIYASLQGSGKSQVLQSTKSCHTEGKARSISQAQQNRDISVSSKPQYDNRDSSLRATHSAQNDKNIDSRNDRELHAKAQKIFNEFVEFAKQEGNAQFLKFKNSTTLKAQNYVGLIQTKSGFCLEILPKTFRTANQNEGFKIQNCTCESLQSSACHTERSEVSKNLNKDGDIPFSSKSQYDNVDSSVATLPQNDNNKVDCHADKSASNDSKKCQVCKAKDILLKMLETLKNSPFKPSHISNLATQNTPLLEVFAMMFLDELESLIKKGIKSDYVVCEENRAFLKGKLLFTPNLKHNFAHKERFYTASDEFIANIAPNRLIVSALLFLTRQNFHPKTSTRILQSRFVFDEISPSQNYDKDFAKCVNLRHFKSYELVLLWCKVFLKRHNFIPYQGLDKAFALLFDMNELFESFVAYHLKKYVAQKDYKCQIKAQESSKHLLEVDGVGKFQIKPDIVCRKDNTTIFIADTKWKILDFSRNDYGISQGDLYQLFAYLAKYQCENGLLIFPKIDLQIDLLDSKDFSDKDTSKEFIYKAKSNLSSRQNLYKLQIRFFDCTNPSDSVKQFLQNFL